MVVTAEEQGQFSRQTILFSRPVWLPAHSFRHVEFPVRPDFRSETEPGKMKVEKVLTVRLTGGKPLAASVNRAICRSGFWIITGWTRWCWAT